MKTSEFIKKMDKLGYEVVVYGYHTRVYRGATVVAEVYNDEVKALNTYWDVYVTDELFDLCVEYARTPIKERKEDKKYYLYNPVKKVYFNYFAGDEGYHWDTSTQTYEMQTQFTEEEIKNHKFSDIMELLEKVEV